jgi:hypothetical protein
LAEKSVDRDGVLFDERDTGLSNQSAQHLPAPRHDRPSPTLGGHGLEVPIEDLV